MLKVIAIEDGMSKGDVPMKKYTFEDVKFEHGYELKGSSKTLPVKVLFDDRKLENGDVIKAHQLYGKLGIGDRISGNYQTVPTTEYLPEGFNRPLTVFGSVVLDGETIEQLALRDTTIRKANAKVWDKSLEEWVPSLPITNKKADTGTNTNSGAGADENVTVGADGSTAGDVAGDEPPF